MTIELTTHAINRYQERVKPNLSWSAARKELRTLADHHGRIVPSLDWVKGEAPNHVALMELSDGIALALSDKLCDRCAGVGYGLVAGRTLQCVKCKGKQKLPIYVATTVLIRGGMDEGRRERKKERGARERWRRKVRRFKPRHDGRGIPDPEYE